MAVDGLREFWVEIVREFGGNFVVLPLAQSEKKEN